MAKIKSTTFYQKRVSTSETLSFQEILESLDLTQEQRQQVEGKKTYTLNNISSYEGMYYAEIVCFERDKSQGIIYNNIANVNLEEKHITTKDIDEDNDSEFINSRIIFGVSGNNLVISPSVLKEERFIKYFNFLLNTYYWKDKSNTNIITLQDIYTKTLKDKLKSTHVKSVEIGQGVITETTNSQSNKPYRIENNSILGKISSIFHQEYGFKSDLDDSNLRASIIIDYSKSTSTEGQKFLDDITASLATIDSSQIKIHFTDGTEYKYNKVRQKSKINIYILEDNNFDRVRLKKDIFTFLEQNITDE